MLYTSGTVHYYSLTHDRPHYLHERGLHTSVTVHYYSLIHYYLQYLHVRGLVIPQIAARRGAVCVLSRTPPPLNTRVRAHRSIGRWAAVWETVVVGGEEEGG